MAEPQDHGDDRRASGMALQEEPDRSLVRAWGEIDLAVRQAAGPMCQTVADRGLPVEIDAGEVTFIDSTGMSILVRLARDGEANGYPVTLADAPWMLQELLTITGVDRLLPVAGEGDAPPSSGPADDEGP